MDKGIKAAQTQLARERVRAATLALVERHGLDEHAQAMAAADAAPVTVRDLRQLEAVADLLEALVLTEGATAPDATQASELAALSSVSPAVAERLAEAGITNVVTLRDATDDELRAVDGIGAATLRAIRAEVGEPTVPAADAGAAAPPGGADAAEASEDGNAADADDAPPAEAGAGEDGA